MSPVDDNDDESPLSRAYVGVSPLKGGRRIKPPVAGPVAASAPHKHPPLKVTHDDDGVIGVRSRTHRSIVDALADPELAVAAELDLHGLEQPSARREIGAFIKRCSKRGVRYALIIHGKGKHSGAGGGVLAEVVVDMLANDLAGFVLAFRNAPTRLGGAGATVLCLTAGAKP